MNDAKNLNDLSNLKGNHFKHLHGNQKGIYGIRINLQWRIYFRWDDQGPYDVEILDPH